MQDRVEAIIGEAVSSSTFGAYMARAHRPRQPRRRFSDEALVKWFRYHKFQGKLRLSIKTKTELRDKSLAIKKSIQFSDWLFGLARENENSGVSQSEGYTDLCGVTSSVQKPARKKTSDYHLKFPKSSGLEAGFKTVNESLSFVLSGRGGGLFLYIGMCGL